MSEQLNLVVSALPPPCRAGGPAELCEHKGIGHPDSICDGVAEAARQALCHAYQAHYGALQHHNVDKALLIGGESRPRFGGGSILQRPRLILCGRATACPGPQHAADVVREAASAYLASHLRQAAGLIDVEAEVRSGSPNLRQVFTRQPGVAFANDTSFGTGYYPLSPLEEAVLDLAGQLKSTSFRHLYPAAGDDYKIMGRRNGHQMDFTIALAMVDRYIHHADDYEAVKRHMQRHLGEHIGWPHGVHINVLDAAAVLREEDCFLTVSGLSCEHGDDGQVGRGNRVNGLITPGRGMSLEAAAGKNPVAHAGKLYNLLAQRLAQTLFGELDDTLQVTVQLLSSIGSPLDQPALAVVQLVQPGELTAATEQQVRRCVAAGLKALPELTAELVAGRVPVF